MDIQVFLSSTEVDLKAYREAAHGAIEGLDGYQCVRMEDFGARDELPADLCERKVTGSDVYVGILGHRYGSIPPGGQNSYTEIEYEAALSADLHLLLFLAPDDFPIPASLVEPDDKRQRQRALRERVKTERVVVLFQTPDDLAAKVTQALGNLAKRPKSGSQLSATAPPPLTLGGPDPLAFLATMPRPVPLDVLYEVATCVGIERVSLLALQESSLIQVTEGGVGVPDAHSAQTAEPRLPEMLLAAADWYLRYSKTHESSYQLLDPAYDNIRA